MSRQAIEVAFGGAGGVLNRVSVDDETARYARIALERMLQVV